MTGPMTEPRPVGLVAIPIAAYLRVVRLDTGRTP